MLYGNLNSQDTYSYLKKHPVWEQAFQWLEGMPKDVKAGIHEVRGRDMFVNVHGYDPLPRSECRYESHRKYLDLQYCISGGELIEWQLSTCLDADGGYDEEKDLQFYKLKESKTVLHMLPGNFAIFHPSDAHLPKVSDSVNQTVFKLVIKIGLHLL